MIDDKPIPFVIEIPMHGGLNNKLDSSEIEDTEFQTADKTIFDDGVAEKAPIFSTVNTGYQLESGAKIDGTWRSYAKDGTARLIACCNGSIYESSDWTAALYTALTAGYRCTFTDYRNKTIITNGVDYPVVYDPETNTVEGTAIIRTPAQVKKIAYFESDETWTGSGVATDAETHVDDEVSGDSLQGLKLTAGAGATVTAERTVTLDADVFDDSSTITGWDFVDIDIYHRIRSTISSITLTLETSTGKYYQASVHIDLLDIDEERDYRWTRLNITRDAFVATSTPAWDTITKLKIALTANAGTLDSVVTFDNWRFRRTPPQAGDFRKDIATFEPSDETWTGGAVENHHFKEDLYGGQTGLKLVDGDESAYCDKTLDLSKWITGAAIRDSDDIKIWAKINDSTKITSITIKLGDSDLTNHFYKTWTTAGSDFNTGTDLWNELIESITNFTETGTMDWADVVRIQVEAVLAAGGEVIFDHWAALLKDSELEITTIESGTSGETVTFDGGAWSTDYAAIGDYSYEMDLYQRRVSPAWAKCVFTSAKDLSVWADSTTSEDTDRIQYWISRPNLPTVVPRLGWLHLDIDCNNGDFATDYFTYGYLVTYPWYPGEARLVAPMKSQFTRHGATGGKGWDTVKGIRFRAFNNVITADAFKFHIDDLRMVRSAAGFSGRFQWKCVFKYKEIRSPASEVSPWTDITRAIALITHIPTSPDSRIVEREMYRREYGDADFRFAFIVPDNSSTVWYDPMDNPGLTMSEMGVPDDSLTPPKGRVAIEYKDRIILFQDPEDLKRAYYTDPYLIYSFSDLNARDFTSEIVGGAVHFDGLYFFHRDGRIQRGGSDFPTAKLEPLGDIIKCVSPWGVAKVGESIAILTEDDIKLFTGYQGVSIGKAIADYFDQASYKTHEAVLFHHKDHLYYSVETVAGGSYKLFDCYVPTLKWEDRGLDVNCFAAYTGSGDKNELVYGGYDGYVYMLGTTYNHTMAIRTKDIGEVYTAQGKGYLFHEKEIQEVRIIAKGGDSTSGALTLKIYKNGADAGESITIPSSGHLATVYHTYVITLTGVYNAIVGQLLGVQISHATATKNPLIKAVSLTGVVLPLEQEFTDE